MAFQNQPRPCPKKYLITQKRFNRHASQRTQINSSIFQQRLLFKISVEYHQKISVKNNTGNISDTLSEYCFKLCFFSMVEREQAQKQSLIPRTGLFLIEWPWEKSLCFLELPFFNYKTGIMACALLTQDYCEGKRMRVKCLRQQEYSQYITHY